MKTNTNSKFDKVDLKVISFASMAPKKAGELKKISVGFEEGDNTLYWNRYVHTPTSIIEKSEDPELSVAEATQIAKEKNAKVREALEVLGFDKNDPKSFNPIGKEARCAVEEDERYGRKVAFINRPITHVKMDEEAQAKFLSELL